MTSGHGGEVDDAGKLRCTPNSSPEIASATIYGGRGRTWRPVGQSTAKPCQEDVPHENKAKGTRERARVVKDLSEKEVVTGGHDGAPGVCASSLVAASSLEWGQKEEGVKGFL